MDTWIYIYAWFSLFEIQLTLLKIMWLFNDREVHSYLQDENVNYKVLLKNVNGTFVTWWLLRLHVMPNLYWHTLIIPVSLLKFSNFVKVLILKILLFFSFTNWFIIKVQNSSGHMMISTHELVIFMGKEKYNYSKWSLNIYH